ncbi:hypothetical protein TraAM80_07280 [Trypanosoma rangeli]|uniref:Uncharacterized protein n=1 Tax=Trypanosoma rangeli TaxID=5698 RepID=A0A3R7K3E4_TRYRA|nr:uncharacterized protein TraAM80_07280 [Trypanosoma rangeli]RNF01006.1 hypothetical protein TraAM80_07280 [Trypanosoma rangeli]|eukprot:RNF01006.1 hypothetical protein TraAM80_07280 [Trypanosoma rangeli]
MRTSHLFRRKLPSLGCCLFWSAATVALAQGQRASWHTPARFIVSGGGKKGTGNPKASSVKRMPPPPPPRQQRQKPAASSQQAHPEPLLASQRPLLDVDKIIIALTDVFIAYQKHLRACNTVSQATATSHSKIGGENGVRVPFYPPVPLGYIEKHFQPLLLRLLPADVTRGDGNSKAVRVSDNSTDAGINRQHLTSRIQSSGVFTLTSLQRRMVQREEASNEDGTAILLRLRPGVRELAVEIATFLFSLEPQKVTVRRAVPLAVIRRMSLTPAAASFIRHELANDVRRLLLVYTHDVFAVTKNGTMVQLLAASVEDGKGVLPVTLSATTAATREPAQDLVTSAAHTQENVASFTNTEADAKMLPDHVAFPFSAGEEGTVVHMGKRFIAPAAMERYRLSRCLAPFLDFISVIVPVGDGSGGENGSLVVAETDDGFVDFAAIRDRAVANYPSLAPLLVLDHGDLPKLRCGLLLSALSALGVECRWGRSLPPQHQRQQRQLQRLTTNIGSPDGNGPVIPSPSD